MNISYCCKVGGLCAIIAHIVVVAIVWSPRVSVPVTEEIPGLRGMHHQSLGNTQCRNHPQQHLYFLKIHKAASTTTYSMFARFALSRNLKVMTLQKRYCSYPHRYFDEYLPPTPRALTTGQYDIYCEHSVDDEEYLLSKLHNDTVNIAIVREPMSHVRSTFLHYRLPEKLNLEEYDDPLAEFLERPLVHSKKVPRAVEYTSNRVAKEFGYQRNRSNVEDYLEYIDSRFLVLVFERYLESLIVMKRKLCWSMKDILHAHANKHTYEKPERNETLISLHKALSPLDYVFYDFFKQRMDELISKQDDDFQEEVQLFKNYLENTSDICDSVCARMGALRKSGAGYDSLLSVVNDVRHFAESKWDQGFNVTGLDCLLMRYSPKIFRDSQRVRLFPESCSKANASLQSFRFNPEYCDRSFMYGLPRSIINQSNFGTHCF